ncbi:MAG: hypothetical protein NXH82_08305 [Rhodobacteraceae bacterium]|nr:hypothetical protein [Paracoccaceae bacterium]
MTNTVAFGLAVAIVGAISLDVFWFGTEHIYFLARKMIDLIEWMAFWR